MEATPAPAACLIL